VKLVILELLHYSRIESVKFKALDSGLVAAAAATRRNARAAASWRGVARRRDAALGAANLTALRTAPHHSVVTAHPFTSYDSFMIFSILITTIAFHFCLKACQGSELLLYILSIFC